MTKTKSQTKTTWRKVKLGKVVENSIGGDWGKEKLQGDFIIESYVIRGTDIPSLQIGDISTLQKRFIKKSSLEKRKLKEGDIIMEVSGGSTDQPVGRPLFISRNLLEKLDKPIIYSNFCRRIRAKKEVNPIFLYFQLYMFYNSPEVYNFQTQSTGISNFHFSDFLKYKEITLPDVVTQKRIAEILSVFDEKIELNNKIIKILEEMAQAIFKEWFIKFNFPVEFEVKSEKLKVKSGKLIKISDFIDIISGYPFSSKLYNKDRKGLGVVTIKNVQDGNFITACDSFIDNKNIPKNMNTECRIHDGDILLSLTGNVGRVCFVYGGEYLLNQRVAKLKPKNEQYYAFCYFLFRQPFMQNRLINMAKGSAQPNLSPVETGEIELDIPSREILDKFCEIVIPIYKQLIKSKVENQKLAALRDLLLPKLMSGEILVKSE